MMKHIFIACACLLITVSARIHSPKERLTRDLLRGYQSDIDPGKTEVKFGLSILCAHVNSDTGIATVNAWEYHQWTDSRLSWNPSEYSGVEELNLAAKLVWTPDLRLFNSLSASDDRDRSLKVVVVANGTVYWIPPVNYNFHCQRGENNESTCSLHIGSWTYDGNHLPLKAHGGSAESGVELSYYNEACPSVVTSHTEAVETHFYPCCEDRPYPSLDLKLVVKPRGAA